MKICVIGAGPAGMLAAITAASNGADVTVFEKNDRVGKKLLTTGNGKCNLSSAVFNKNRYNCPDSKVLESVFKAFGVNKTLSFFESIGVVSVIGKNNGYYPRAEQASVVLDALRRELDRRKVTVISQCSDLTVTKKKDKFCVLFGTKVAEFDSVIIATGSKASPKTGSDGSGYKLAQNFGHTVITPLPALVPFVCSESFFKAIAGIRQNGRISLYVGQTLIAEEEGEIQITETGISGIPVFQVSRFAAYPLSQHRQVTAVIDFAKEYEANDLKDALNNYRRTLPETLTDDLLSAFVNKKLATQIRKNALIEKNKPFGEISDKEIYEIVRAMKEFTVNVVKTTGFDNAQICVGGVDLNEVNENLESKLCERLYFAGEILDVDGDCGGFNLQWAWSSGYVSGYHASRKEA